MDRDPLAPYPADPARPSWWRRRPYVHFVRLAVLSAALICVSEFLLTMIPCFILLAHSPDLFGCFLVVGIYVEQVGHFYEVRHIPVLLVLSALQLLAVGVIGEYLWRVADEVRGAPSFVIASRLGEDAHFCARPNKRLIIHDVIEIPRRY